MRFAALDFFVRICQNKTTMDILHSLLVISVVCALCETHYLNERNCFRYENTLRCIRLNKPPKFPPGLVRSIERLDLRGCMIQSVRILDSLKKWPNLLRVDVRQQITNYNCSVRANFTFEIIDDCLVLVS